MQMLVISSQEKVIIQYGKTISFYRRKVTGLQKWYTVTEKELISLVESLKEFHTILLGQQLNIYIDHKNRTWKNSTPIVCYGGDL